MLSPHSHAWLTGVKVVLAGAQKSIQARYSPSALCRSPDVRVYIVIQ